MVLKRWDRGVKFRIWFGFWIEKKDFGRSEPALTLQCVGQLGGLFSENTI